MGTSVVLPQMGLEVNEATVVAVHVAVGDTVAAGEPLLEVETDKALTDVVAPQGGVVAAVDVEVGDTVPVGATLMRLTEDGAEVAASAQAAAPEPVVAAAARPAPDLPSAVGAGEPARIRAAPVARRAAMHHGIPLESIQGTGPRGRITLRDVEGAVAEIGTASRAPAAPAAASGPAAGRLEPLSATRRLIARRMTESQTIPQFSLQRDIDAAWLLSEKERLSAETDAKVSVSDLLVQAFAEAVGRHSALAASFVEEQDGGQPQLLRPDGVGVGLAVATDRGLLVPVIRRAHEVPLGELVLERARLVAAARSGRIDTGDMSGATVTLSNLGGFGIDRFNAMLNPGESAILAVGRTVDRVVPRDRGLTVVPTMSLTLTLDHRVVDGATGARALSELAELLEGAMAWRT